MSKKAADTATGLATIVAVEQQFPIEQRLLDDSMVVNILPLSGKVFVWLTKFSWIRNWFIGMTEKKFPGVWAIFPVRKRYIDDQITAVMTEQFEAVVNLGAGFDTLPFRLPELNLPVYEVDQPFNSKAKKENLIKALGSLPKHLLFVPIDFDHQDLGNQLTSHGYSNDHKTFFILEAVSQYLTQDGIENTFDFLSKAKSGSRLVFTYVRQDFLDGKNLYNNQELHKKLVLKEKIWLSGIDPLKVEEFLEQFGWKLIEHVGYEDLAEAYIKPTKRTLGSLLLERIVYAEKK